MTNPWRLARLAVAGAPLLGLLAFAAASPIAAQQKSVLTKPPTKCYSPPKHKATIEWMGDHPDRPLHKGCPSSVGKVIGKYCYTCEGYLDVATKWCYARCNAGSQWHAAKKQCCG